MIRLGSRYLGEGFHIEKCYCGGVFFSNVLTSNYWLIIRNG